MKLGEGILTLRVKRSTPTPKSMLKSLTLSLSSFTISLWHQRTIPTHHEHFSIFTQFLCIYFVIANHLCLSYVTTVIKE